MLLNQPRLITPVIYAVAGIATIAADESNSPGWLLTLLWPVRATLFAASFLSLANWIRTNLLEGLERLHRIRTTNKVTVLAEQLRYLTKEQLDYLQSQTDETEQESDAGTTNIDGLEIPNSWLKNYFLAASGMTLKPLHAFSENSVDRKYATILHKKLRQENALLPRSGNQPVRIAGWNQVYEAIGWV